MASTNHTPPNTCLEDRYRETSYKAASENLGQLSNGFSPTVRPFFILFPPPHPTHAMANVTVGQARIGTGFESRLGYEFG